MNRWSGFLALVALCLRSPAAQDTTLPARRPAQDTTAAHAPVARP